MRNIYFYRSYFICNRFYHKYSMLRKINNDFFNLTSNFEL